MVLSNQSGGLSGPKFFLKGFWMVGKELSFPFSLLLDFPGHI